MGIICKNCSKYFVGHYCNNCGQSSNTHKIDFHFLWHDIQHGILHFDKGILYTAKQLFTRPGHSIREFIHGKRVNHFKPISLVIILATIYGITYHYFYINQLKADLEHYDFIFKIYEWTINHYYWINLLSIPFTSLTSFWAFKKSGYNYVEHLTLNSFIAGQSLLVQLALLPFEFLDSKQVSLLTVSNIAALIGIVLRIWSYIQFFKKYSTVRALLLTFLSLIYLLALLIAACVVLAFILIFYSKAHD